MSDVEGSVFQSELPLETKLERARTELLDLSARNRLLNVPRFSKSAKTIDVVDERSAEVFRLLTREGKALSFLAGRPDRPKSGGEANPEPEIEEEAYLVELPQPEDDEVDDRGIARRHADAQLQTRMTPTGLQKRLLDLYHDARTLEEEQGVNILFLALGTLKWVDPSNKENVRHAPLVLVPVRLERGTAGEKFRLRARAEDLTANLSLEAYLDRVHALKLPAFEGGDEFDPSAYFANVAEAVATKADWTVNPDDIVLGFFSFAKFLMYRDLDPGNWPDGSRLTDQPLVRALLADGFQEREALLSEDAPVDQHIAPRDMLHIVDSDSSQTMAVHEVRRGRDLVIQGPPGTGKSQTIANVIASAVADGKTVLFVAEKMAALEVVKRRLDQAGVGDACLELHSNKANKRAILDELRRTWELGSPRGDMPSSLADRLLETRDTLNLHADRMHDAHEPSGVTPYQVIGQMVRLRQSGQAPVNLELEVPTSWTPDDLATRRRLMQEVVQRIEDIGLPVAHPWHGIGLEAVLPTTVERLVPRLSAIEERTKAAREEISELAATLGVNPPPATFADSAAVLARADVIAAAPVLSPAALASDVWDERPVELQALLDAGRRFALGYAALAPSLTADALDRPIADLVSEIEGLPSTITPDTFGRARALLELLPRLRADVDRLARIMDLPISHDTIAAMARLVATAERVAAAPGASPEAFASTAWEISLEQAGDLTEAVIVLEKSRAALGDRVSEAAWNTDVAATRQALATHTGFLKILSGDYRRAKALVSTLLRDPSAPTATVIDLLDTLTKGQAAATRLREGDALGRACFGADWRGDRSSSAPLLALTDWMRTLRGLGSEPRLIASRTPDRSEIGPRTVRVKALLDEIHPLVEGLFADLDASSSGAFGDVLLAEKAPLDLVQAMVARMVSAEDRLLGTLAAPPAATTERLDLLRRLAALQTLDQTLNASDDLGRAAFGKAWTGRTSDWDDLAAAASWIAEHGSLRHLAASLADRDTLAERARRAATEAGALTAELDAVAAFLKSDSMQLFGAPRFADVSLNSALRTLGTWLGHTEQLSKWVAYRERADKARASGMKEIIERLADGRLAPADAASVFEMAYHEALLEEIIEARPEIGRFDGTLHSRLVQEFANLDREKIKVSSLEVARAHHRRIPPRDGNLGPLSILRGEMLRKRGQMPIRSLMLKAGPAIQALKPVLMMSPLSVAQFLTPGRMTFDLLVMDEASQIQPVDALGAIARARQVVVVGDERQLPPTRFFAKMTGAQAEDDEGEGAQVADIESILGLFVARGLPQRMLRWHYRSRHQSLIAVSNSQFYENKLFIVPSPYTQEAGMGLRFHYVEGGLFDSGGSGTNRVEAKAVAEAIIRHAKAHPELSLGVTTFSVAQRRAIQDELELLRRANPDTEEFFHAHPSEPFFVKNLENVQGDERDVIMISVGYAKNANGVMAMRFGPLGSEGGERRLNVLISRAKRRCEVFASITDEDIVLDRAKGKGVFAFKLFLQYARTGRLSLAHASGRAMDSVFEEQVAAALQARGYQVHPQVGIAGLFIDLAIADPERPGRYLLGIECDGASYHSARSARDRDRLRQSVLEDHGWIIHRIWSTDWFQRPQEQLERTVAAIEAAKAELDERLELGRQKAQAVPVQIVTVDRGDVTEIGLADIAAETEPQQRYIEATVARPGSYELHETPTGVMAQLVEQVVTVESPVHVDEVVARVRDAWGLQRAGGRIQSAVQQGIDAAWASGRILREGEFLTMPGSTTHLRDRSGARSPGLRKPEMIPPSEIAVGLEQIVAGHLGATEDELILAVSRLIGFKATSAQLRTAIASVVAQLLKEGRLERQGTMLVVRTAARAPEPAE